METDEILDCCTSSSAESTCTTFGYINGLVLAAILGSWLILLVSNTWFRTNALLSFTVLFQTQPALFRSWFYLSAGWSGASAGLYITIRSSDPGDFVVSLTGFAMYLYQLEQGYSRAREPSFSYDKLKRKLACSFWIFFVTYSTFWGGFWYWSSEAKDLAYVDFFMTAYFLFLICLYTHIGSRLISAIYKYLKEDKGSGNAVPGIKQVSNIILLQTIAMSLRTVFTPLQDIQKMGDIDFLSKDNSYWPVLMTIECLIQLFAVAVLYASIYLIHKAEKAIAEHPEAVQLTRQEVKSDEEGISIIQLD